MKTIRYTLAVILLISHSCPLVYGNPAEQNRSPYCANAIGLQTTQDLNKLIERCSGSRLVLLGESTHGTADFYYWRAEISKRLITEQGFRFIVVEGDWASLYRLNLYVKGMSQGYNSAKEVLRGFSRWPQWMWANTEVASLAEWLREYNMALPVEERVGFYGMDVYGQWEALEAVLVYAQANLPDKYEAITKQLGCFTAFGHDEWQYARAVQGGHPSCFDALDEVVEMLNRELHLRTNPEELNSLRHAKQSAKVVRSAEQFFRYAVSNSVTSWNSRVMHMHGTVTWLLDVYGEGSRGIVWAHNTHTGDARATTMRNDGSVNIGQLSRELHTDGMVTIIGFATNEGKVNAGTRWESPMQRMRIPSGKEGSLEEQLTSCGLEAFYIIFDGRMRSNPELLKPIDHRAIGVVYNPSMDRLHNYVPSIVPLRYDALVFIRKTKPLQPVR